MVLVAFLFLPLVLPSQVVLEILTKRDKFFLFFITGAARPGAITVAV